MVIFVEVVSTRFSQEVKARKRKKEVTINGKQFYIYFGLFQTCADFKSIRIYRFCALDRVNISPSANVLGNLLERAVQGGQPAGQYLTDFEIDL